MSTIADAIVESIKDAGVRRIYVNGLYDANRSRVPVLAIAAQIPGADLGETNLFRRLFD